MKPAYIFKTLAVCFLMAVTACSGMMEEKTPEQ